MLPVLSSSVLPMLDKVGAAVDVETSSAAVAHWFRVVWLCRQYHTHKCFDSVSTIVWCEQVGTCGCHTRMPVPLQGLAALGFAI